MNPSTSPTAWPRILHSPHWLGAFAFTLFFPGMTAPRRALLLTLALIAGYQGIRALRRNGLTSARVTGFSEPVLNWFLVWGLLACASLTWTANAAQTASAIYHEVMFAFVLLAATCTARAPLDSLRSVAYAGAAAVFVLAAGALVAVNTPIPNAAAVHGDWFYVSDAAWKMLPRTLQPGGPGVLSTQLLIALLLFAALFVIEPTRRNARIGLLMAGLALPLAYSTSNRMFWLALGLGAAPLIWSYTAGRLTTSRRIALLALAFAVCAATLTLNAHQKWQLVYGNHVQSAANLLLWDERLQLWPAVFQLIGERPVLGYGFGHAIARDPIHALTGRDYHHGHNFFLNVALQLGLLGAFTSLALVALVARRAAKAAWDVAASRERVVAGHLLLAWLLAFIAKNATDDFVIREAGLSTWLSLGLALALASGPGAKRR